MSWSTELRIATLVCTVERTEASFGLLSTGEKIAVALVLDRHDLVKEAWGTMIESMYRLGGEWFKAAREVQRRGAASYFDDAQKG